MHLDWVHLVLGKVTPTGSVDFLPEHLDGLCQLEIAGVHGMHVPLIDQHREIVGDGLGEMPRVTQSSDFVRHETRLCGQRARVREDPCDCQAQLPCGYINQSVIAHARHPIPSTLMHPACHPRSTHSSPALGGRPAGDDAIIAM